MGALPPERGTGMSAMDVGLAAGLFLACEPF